MEEFEKEWERIVNLLQAKDRLELPKETVKSLCAGFYLKGKADAYTQVTEQLQNFEIDKDMDESIERYNKAKADGTLDEKFPRIN